MDDDSAEVVEENELGTIFEAGSLESSEDPPMDQWSSLEMVCDEKNRKRILQEEGMYDPGTADICPKYIALSASSVMRHVYYLYPAITDPGILTALLKPEEPAIYSDDGQALYLAVCKSMNQSVVRTFYKGLLDNDIDLRYYCVNPIGVRAMAMALKYNKIVQRINFTDNVLSQDAAYHLGDMLASNTWLVELNLSGCRIGPVGVQHLLVNMVSNRTLKVLNLSKNDIGDEGMVYFANAVWKGLAIKELDLSHNGISGKGIVLLAEPFEAFNKITNWNLSWNNLFTPGTPVFLIALSATTKDVTDINLSWNSLSTRVGPALKRLLSIKALKHLDLSHNQLEGEVIKEICSCLGDAKKLISLNLSYNPMTPTDAIAILKKLKLKKVKVSNVNMENVTVDKVFIRMLQEVQRIKPKLILKFGIVKGVFQPVGPDYRELLFKRMEFLCKKPKKKKVDIALVLLQLQKDKFVSMLSKDFYTVVSAAGAPVDSDLIDEVCVAFPSGRAGKEKAVSINALVEYSTRMFPDRKLPPTPPPEPEPIPIPEPEPEKKGKGKGKSKK